MVLACPSGEQKPWQSMDGTSRRYLCIITLAQNSGKSIKRKKRGRARMKSNHVHDLYNLARYDYSLPKELIAQSPAEPRDTSRLLVLHKDSGEIDHSVFKELPSYLNKGDLIVLNNTKVMAARIIGKKKREQQK